MPALVDVWRAIDPDAELTAGDPDRLRAPVRGIARTRATPPHLPDVAAGELLVVDAAALAEANPHEIFDGLRETSGEPTAVVFAGAGDRAGGPLSATDAPVLLSAMPASTFVSAARAYLEREAELLERWGLELRVAMAEAALADPHPSSASAVACARVRRGVAVARHGRLVGVHPRRGGRDLALRFTATFNRLFSGPSHRRQAERRTRSGLWVAEFPVARGEREPARVEDAAVWLFDDAPFAAIDRIAGDALARTLRALLAAGRGDRSGVRLQQAPGRPSAGAPGAPRTRDDRLATTVLAVARNNGRVAPAARALGVHRNTVLYRLRQARHELGVDPRRPEDALRLLRERGGADPP